jgi:hypothetical protein
MSSVPATPSPILLSTLLGILQFLLLFPAEKNASPPSTASEVRFFLARKMPPNLVWLPFVTYSYLANVFHCAGNEQFSREFRMDSRMGRGRRRWPNWCDSRLCCSCSWGCRRALYLEHISGKIWVLLTVVGKGFTGFSLVYV